MRAVVAGSSAELDFAFHATTVMRGNRWDYYELEDPPEAVAAALLARGYSAADARAMTGLCGTRLRDLGNPLRDGAARLSAPDFVRSATTSGCAAFTTIFAELLKAPGANADAAPQLARVLDAIAARVDETSGVDSRDESDVTPHCAPPPRLTLADLPPAAREIDVSTILYVTRSGGLAFQSQLHRRTWPLVRATCASQK